MKRFPDRVYKERRVAPDCGILENRSGRMKKMERFFGLFEIMSTFVPNSCCIRLTVRTVDSQSTNTGSIPVCSTVSRRKTRRLFCLSPERTRRPVCRGKRNFDEDAWKGGAGPIGYLSATEGFLLSVAGCRRLPCRTDLSCAVRRLPLRGSVWPAALVLPMPSSLSAGRAPLPGTMLELME